MTGLAAAARCAARHGRPTTAKTAKRAAQQTATDCRSRRDPLETKGRCDELNDDALSH